jgi:hypothetical protein
MIWRVLLQIVEDAIVPLRRRESEAVRSLAHISGVRLKPITVEKGISIDVPRRVTLPTMHGA